MKDLFVLVHSPLVGPLTWSLVAQRLQAIGVDVLVPALSDNGETPPPYWQQHAASFQRALASVPQERPLVLAGHSGAGALLPVLAQATEHPVNAYLFVDAGLPHPGQSRLAEMAIAAHELRHLLAAGSRFPNRTNQELREVVPDEGLRQHLLSEMRARALDFFEEALPDVPGWSDAQCGYLLFTEGYRPYLERAQRADWPNRTLPAGHFHMLVDPGAVATALLELIKQANEKR
jgi:pimeloyl-ACP methyl ester carboxylesterase